MLNPKNALFGFITGLGIGLLSTLIKKRKYSIMFRSDNVPLQDTDAFKPSPVFTDNQIINVGRNQENTDMVRWNQIGTVSIAAPFSSPVGNLFEQRIGQDYLYRIVYVDGTTSTDFKAKQVCIQCLEESVGQSDPIYEPSMIRALSDGDFIMLRGVECIVRLNRHNFMGL